MVKIYFRGWRIIVLNKKDITVKMTFGLKLRERDPGSY